MTVAFDAKSSAVVSVNGATSLTISNLTVGAGSNRAVFAIVSWATSTAPTGVTAVWDNGGTNQSMSLVPGTNGSTGVSTIATSIYELPAPTSGNKSLKISWTGSFEAHAAAISFTGVDQTTPGQNGAAVLKTTVTASPCSVPITSATGDMAIAGFIEQVSSWGTISGTTIAKDDTTGPAQAWAANYTSGASSVTATAAFSGSDAWAAWGCDVKAAGGGTAYTLSGAEGSFAISGQTATTAAARKLAGVEGSFSISGQAAALSHNYKIAGAEGAFTISGQAAAELRGIKMGGTEGAFVISGQAATLTLTTSGHYTLTGAEGSFTISGQAATLAAARKLAGAEGAFSISGQAGTLNAARKMPGIEGAFVISGQASSELRGIKVAGAEGAFTISGGAAVLGHGLHLAGVEGSFTISGQSAKFPVALSMKGGEGSFVISGGAAVLAYTPAGGGGATLPHSNPFFSTPGPGMALP